MTSLTSGRIEQVTRRTGLSLASIAVGSAIGMLLSAVLTALLCVFAIGFYSLYWAGLLGSEDGLITTLNATLEYGDTVSAEMSSLDQAHDWEFKGEAGDRVDIDVTSAEGDPYIRLIGPSGNVVSRNDDFGQTLDSHIATTLPETGSYTIRISVYRPGHYELKLDRRAAMVP